MPQWITISWGGGEMNDETFKNLHSSMLNNVDIDYIYHYFLTRKNKRQTLSAASCSHIERRTGCKNGIGQCYEAESGAGHPSI